LAAREQPLAGFSAKISERHTLAAKPRQLVGPSRKTPATLQRGSYFTGDPNFGRLFSERAAGGIYSEHPAWLLQFSEFAAER
jgi:hypothetical protein